MRRLIALLSISGLSVLGLAVVTASVAPSQAAAVAKHKTKPKAGSVTHGTKPGVGPNGLTANTLCSFVTDAEAQALLNGETPEGAGYPGNPEPGSAECVWATSSGSNNSLSVYYNPSGTSSGCDGIPHAQVLHISGWGGCYDKANFGALVAYEGHFELEFSPDFGPTVEPGVESAMEKVATQVFAKLHA
jgi:hypothetical protein